MSRWYGHPVTRTGYPIRRSARVRSWPVALNSDSPVLMAENDPEDLREMPDFGWHRRPVRVATAVAAVALALTSWGLWNPGNMLYVDRLFNHPVLGGFVVVCAVLVIVGWAVPTRWVRWPLVVVLGSAACLFGLAAAFAVLMADWVGSPTEVVRGPDGDVVAEVRDVGLFVDPSYRVVLVRHDGLLSRELVLGDVGEWYEDIRFDDGTTLVIKVGANELWIAFNPRNLEVRSSECRQDGGEVERDRCLPA